MCKEIDVRAMRWWSFNESLIENFLGNVHFGNSLSYLDEFYL